MKTYRKWIAVVILMLSLLPNGTMANTDLNFKNEIGLAQKILLDLLGKPDVITSEPPFEELTYINRELFGELYNVTYGIIANNVIGVEYHKINVAKIQKNKNGIITQHIEVLGKTPNDIFTMIGTPDEYYYLLMEASEVEIITYNLMVIDNIEYSVVFEVENNNIYKAFYALKTVVDGKDLADLIKKIEEQINQNRKPAIWIKTGSVDLQKDGENIAFREYLSNDNVNGVITIFGTGGNDFTNMQIGISNPNANGIRAREFNLSFQNAVMEHLQDEKWVECKD